MDFNTFENNLVDFFDDNYKTYAKKINENLIYDIIINKDFPDGDISGQVNLFILPLQYRYEELTNDSKLMQFEAKIFLLLKQLKVNSEIINEYLRDYATALFDMIYEKNTLSNIVDKSLITDIVFYDEVEGFEYSKAYEASILLLAEIQGN